MSVTGPGIDLFGVGFGNFPTSAVIGAGLQYGQFWARLQGANHGGVTLRIRSADATRVRVSTEVNVVGAAEINVVVPDGSTQVPFYIHAIEGTTGQVTLTASATGFASTDETVTVVQTVLRLSGVPSATTTLSADDGFVVWVDRPNSQGTWDCIRKAVRKGLIVTICPLGVTGV